MQPLYAEAMMCTKSYSEVMLLKTLFLKSLFLLRTLNIGKRCDALHHNLEQQNQSGALFSITRSPGA